MPIWIQSVSCEGSAEVNISRPNLTRASKSKLIYKMILIRMHSGSWDFVTPRFFPQLLSDDRPVYSPLDLIYLEACIIAIHMCSESPGMPGRRRDPKIYSIRSASEAFKFQKALQNTPNFTYLRIRGRILESCSRSAWSLPILRDQPIRLSCSSSCNEC